jgi:hypothetical protein
MYSKSLMLKYIYVNTLHVRLNVLFHSTWITRYTLLYMVCSFVLSSPLVHIPTARIKRKTDELSMCDPFGQQCQDRDNGLRAASLHASSRLTRPWRCGIVWTWKTEPICN